MKILLVQTAFLGDVILSTPIIGNLKRLYPEAEIVLLTTPAASCLVSFNPDVCRVLTYDKRGTQRGLLGFLRMVRMLRGEGFTAVFSLHKSLRTAALLWLSRIPQRFGFREAIGWWLYTSVASRCGLGHEVLRNLALLRNIGFEPDALSQDMRIEVSPAAEEQAAQILMPLAGRDLVGIAPGSVWPTKRWTIDGFIEVAEEFIRRGFAVILIGGVEDRAEAQQISVRLNGPVVNCVGKTSLDVSAALVRRLRLLVSNDSAPLHLASAAGIPTVAVFCATVPEFGYGPWNTVNETVGVSDLDCRPCGRHGGRICPTGTHACQRDLRTGAVIAAADRVLQRSASFSGGAVRTPCGDRFCFQKWDNASILGVVSEAFAADFLDRDIEKLISEFLSGSGDEQIASAEGPRLGRGTVAVRQIASGRSLVFRAYRRGGLLANLVSSTYLRLPYAPRSSLRPFHELHLLNRLRTAGVAVPRPVAAFVSSPSCGLFYSAVLVTERIFPADNLLSLAYEARGVEDKERRFVEVCFAAGKEARRMLGAGILHRDLHPGNVLITPEGRAVLIDFDKAGIVPLDLPREKFLIQLEERWKRSAKKHGLSTEATSAYLTGLSNND